MLLVRHLLEGKRDGVVSLAPETPVLDAIRRMSDRGIGSVLVMRGNALLGIVSERDYARKVALQGRSSATTPLSVIMSSPVKTVSPNATVHECMQLMTEGRFRHLAVVDGERVIGVVSIGDLVKALLDLQQKEIAELQHYISG